MRRLPSSSGEATVIGPGQSIDEQLRFAIASKRLIQFRYHGSLRLAEPHDYGIQNGMAKALVYQLRGPSGVPLEKVIGWRLLFVSKIEGCVALEETFPGSRGRSHRQHLEWDIVYARVA